MTSRLLAPALAALIGCVTAPRIEVRMAYTGEVLPQAPPEPPPPPRRHYFRAECLMSGDPDPRFLDAVVRFARRQFLSDDQAARVHLLGPGRLTPKRRDGIDIVVDPRSIVGRLQISTTHGHWDGGENYCVHVLRTPGVTTLVIESQSIWIK